MRKIAFRAWDKKNKEMVFMGSQIDYNPYDGGTSLLINLDGEVKGYIGDDGGKTGLWEHCTSEKNRFELMQFTGLLDKNNKEIYEGDILKSGKRYWEVIFSRGSFMMRYANGASDVFINEMVEVIGSIYENPELLKVCLE